MEKKTTMNQNTAEALFTSFCLLPALKKSIQTSRDATQEFYWN